MRLHCWFCRKSVSNEMPDEIIVRAVCICPECIPAQLRAEGGARPHYGSPEEER
jgi:hypothetical protein